MERVGCFKYRFVFVDINFADARLFKLIHHKVERMLMLDNVLGGCGQFFANLLVDGVILAFFPCAGQRLRYSYAAALLHDDLRRNSRPIRIFALAEQVEVLLKISIEQIRRVIKLIKRFARRYGALARNNNFLHEVAFQLLQNAGHANHVFVFSGALHLAADGAKRVALLLRFARKGNVLGDVSGSKQAEPVPGSEQFTAVIDDAIFVFIQCKITAAL